ncbi:RNA-binding protein MEX3B-like [Petromyzon marinus]|uniref:RNA-binding protein MEX3B-like n=1 Tax=Petromyzon marinus TaxID=7757 RepID=UPI003F720EF9
MPSSLFADMKQRGGGSSSSGGSSGGSSSDELGVGGGGGGGGGGGVGLGHRHLHPESFDERRALQIALDQLSLLGLDGVPGPGPGPAPTAAPAAAAVAVGAGDSSSSNGGGGGGEDVEVEMEDDEDDEGHHQQQSSVSHAALLLFGGGGGGLGGVGVLDSGSCKRGHNTTECVAVPSSEHVAEIVGRQGCKIKALRAKTNTYIKTPVRGEEPVFVITGRQEDVAMAKREILSAAEHFSVIRASRNKPGALGLPSGGPVPGPPPPVPGQTTIQVRVPYRVVGLVVGPKGATIKRIQQGTHTYIVTPSRDKEPVFEVTGMPENVDRAREEIEAHIALRTGGLIEFNDENDFHVNGTDVGFDNGGNGGGYQPGSLWIRPPRKPFSTNRNDSSSSLGSGGGSTSDSHLGGGSGGSGGSGGGSSSSNGGRYSADFSPTSPFGSSGAFGFGDSLTSLSSEELLIESSSGTLEAGPTALLWAHFERTNPLAVLGSLPGHLHGQGGGAAGLGGRHSVAAIITNGSRLSPTFGTDNGPLLDHPLARRARSDPLTQGLPKYGLSPPELADSCGSGNESDGSLGSGFGGTASGSPGEMADVGEGRAARDCAVCRESAVTAALVPCGHNLFCMECASGICEKGEEPRCPVCLTTVTQAIRIFS